MNKPYIIKIDTATGTVQTVELKTGQEQATVVEVHGRVRVELLNPATGRAPQKVAVRRVAQDLHVVFEEGNPDEPDVILQGFYDTEDNHLVGLAEDGRLFEYIPTSGENDVYVPLLLDGASGIQVLGGAELAADGLLPAFAPAIAAAGISPWLLGAIGLGVVGAAVAIARSGDDSNGGGGNVAILPTPTQRPSGYLDNVGSIQAPDSNAPVTDDNTPGLRIGALPPGATGAVLYVDGVRTPATYDPATGTLTPQTPLPDGRHTLGYGLTNPGGTTPSSPTLEVTIDTVPPTAPVLRVVDADGDGRPDISGTGEPGGLVIITDPTGATHTTTVQPDGSFALEIDRPTTPTGDWRATVTDPAGNVSPPGRVTVTDLTAPVVPTVDGVLDNVGLVTGLVLNNGATDDTTPTYTGTAERGSKVTLFNALNQPIGTTTADAITGLWSLTPTTVLPDGTYTVTARAMDVSGNTSLSSAPFVFTVDTVTPAPATVYSLLDDVGSITGQIVNGTVTDDTRPTMSGKAEANSTITIRDGTQVLGTTSAGNSGYWSFTPTTDLVQGPHSWSATVSDRAGNSSTATTPIAFVVDTTPPAQAMITSVFDDQGASTGNLVNAVATVTDDAQPLIRGTAEANSTVIIKDGTVQIGTASVDGLGIWFFTPTPPLLNGIHHITAAAVDAAGNVGLASGVFDFTLVAGGIASAPAITNVIDDVGSLANIAPNGLTNDPTPTVRGTADAGHTVRLYSEAGALLGTYVVLADGQWSITVPTLADGAHSFTATATDANNNVSPPTQPYQIVVDTTAPGLATVLTLTDNVNPQTGLITTGSTTDDATPTFEGTAEPGATVLVKDGVSTLGTALVNELGRWAFTPTTPLVDGPHALTATVTDKAGNVSLPTAAISFTVDTSAVLVAIDSVSDDVGGSVGPLSPGALTDDLRPTLSGHGTPGGVVKLYVDGIALTGATTTAGPDGRWTITPGTDLNQGTQLLTATVTTPTAGESRPTAAFTLTIDTLAPNVPALVSVEDNVGSQRGLVPAGRPSDDSTPTLEGTAEPLSKVTILDAGQPIGTTMADKFGNWTFTPASPLNDGTHAITLTATDAAGNVSQPSLAWSVVIDTTAPTTAPVITSVFDDQGTSTGNLVSGITTITDDARLLITGTSEPNGSVIIKDGAMTIGTAPVDGAGHWNFLPSTPLLNGPHQITATAVDASGNVGPTSTPFDFTLATGGIAFAPAITNVIDDVGTIANIAPNGLTNDPTPTVKGTAHAGYIVTLYNEAAVVLGTYRVQADGQWSITVPTLTDGVHSFTATATDPTLNVSLPTGAYQITVDTQAPGPATATTLTDNVNPRTGLITTGTTTDDATPTFEGTGEVGATVEIKDGVNSLGTAKVNELGRWTFTPTTPLDDGAHSFTATVTDKAGNASPVTTPINFTVDTTGLAITIDSVRDDVGGIIGLLSPGAFTDDLRPTISGHGTPGGVVKLYLDGVFVPGATTTAGLDGQWSITPGIDLGQGVHLLTATVTTTTAGESPATAPFTLTVDSVAPLRPAILSANDDVGSSQGTIAGGSSTPIDDSTPTLTGTAEPDSKVTILDGGQPIGTTMADRLGNWTFTPASPLNDGIHPLTVTATDAAGNVSRESAPWAMVIDTTAPTTAPVITSVFDDQGSSTGNLVSNVATVTDDASPLITGTSEPNGSVIIKDGLQQIGTAAVNALGIWTLTPTAPLFNGVHHITATAVDASGNVGATSTPFDFTVTTGGTPTAPAITNVIDDVGTITNIAQHGLTNDPTPTVKGTAHAGYIVTLTSESGVVLGTYEVLADGQWSITVPTLTDGAHSFTATATDAANNVSRPTQPYQIVVDTQAPGPATVLTLTDNVNPRTGLITNGTTTDDATPTFEGSGEVGATVEIKDGVNSLGTTKVNELGRWTFTPTTPLDDGAHSFTATVTDKAGNTSSASTPISFTVDTRSQSISINAVTDDVDPDKGPLSDGATTNDLRPTVSGIATPGGIVKLYDETGAPWGATVAQSDGHWYITPAFDLPQGLHTLTATVTTPAAGESTRTAPFNLIIDSRAPDAPTLLSVEDNVGTLRGLVPAGSPSDDSTPTLKGTAEPLSKVTILDGGQPIGTTSTDKLGNWTFTPSSPLNDGTHAITLTSTDAAGNVSQQSRPWNVVVDTTAPTTAPVITSVFDDQGSSTGNLVSGVATITDDASPLITGTSEPNGSVIIKDGLQQIGTAAVNGLGIWTFTPTAPLFNGVHHITATAVDAAGNVGAISTPFDFTLISGGIPTEPAITNVIDDVGSLANIAPNGLTNDPTPTVKGTAHAGYTVTLYSEAAVVLGTYRVLADGQWSITVPTLTDGAHSFTATATDTANNVSRPTQPYQIVVDTQAPGPATVLTLTDNVNPRTGLITNGTTTDDATPTFEGTGEVGATVEIKDGVNSLGTTTVNELGRWIFTPTTPLDDGAHSFTATVIDKSGNVSPPTTPINFTVDTTRVTVAIDSVFDDIDPSTGNLAENASTNDRRPTISGTATPGGTVKLYVDGVEVAGATTTAGTDGQWHITPGIDLAQGPHLLTATVTTPATGESLPTLPFIITIDSFGPAVPILLSVEDNVGTLRGLVPAGSPSDDSTPTLRGTAEPLSKVTILDGGQPIGTTSTDRLGNWTFTPTSPLNDGTHAITLTATDAAGNVSQQSLPWSVVVDTTGPTTAPVITSVFDDQGSSTGNLVSGVATITDDASPLITGTSEPNGSVIIKNGLQQIGTAAVNGAGIWTFTPTTPLFNGVHHITATAVDASGNVGLTSLPFDFTLTTGGITTAPAITNVIDDVGNIENIAQNGLTNDPTPTVKGTAHAGYIVTLHSETGDVLGTYRVLADGQWSITVPTLTDGAHSFTATATDPASNVSLPTQPYQIVVDTQAPGPATVLTLTDNVDPRTGLITNGTTTDDATPTFEGTGEVGATVEIKDGVNSLGTTKVNELGRWTFTPTTPLDDGAHSFSATVTDKAGNASLPTTPINFTVDTSPVAIAIDSVFDDIAPITGNLAANASTNDRRPTISGTATPGGTVKLYVDGIAIPGATTTVGTDGQWHITPGTDLAQGLRLLTATVTTAATGESLQTGPFTITVDSVVPDAPVLLSVTDNVDAIRGLVAAGGSTNDSTPLLKGTAEALSKVTILDGGQPIGTTTADGLGNWTFTPTSPLNDGTHALTLTATDAAGNVSQQSLPWSVVVDTTAPTAAPVITSVFDNQGTATGNLVDNVATVTDDASPLITGTSEPNGSVIIKDGTMTIGTAAVNGAGVWIFTPTTPLLNGVHHITATAVDASGNVGLTSTPFDFTVTTGGVTTAPAITNVIDDVGNIENIAQNGLTNDPTPTVKGTAHAGYTVTLYSEAGVVLGTYAVLADGQWSITVPTLTDGAHSFTATATDPTSNVSMSTQPYQIVVDTVAPGTATVLTLTDNVNPRTGLITNGTTTDDATPTFEGSGEVGATVEIKDGVNSLGTTTVNELGRWTFTPTTPLDDGAHSFTATVTDKAGNASLPTTPINFTVDTSRVTVAIDSVFDDIDPSTGNLSENASTNDRRPTISGTATPGGTVKLYVDGIAIPGATTTVGTDGQWHITPGTDLAQGLRLLTATVTTAATGESLQTGPFTITVDSVVPDAPVLLSVTDNVDAIRGLVAAGGSTNDNTPVLKGTAEALSKVTILDGGQPIGTTTADRLGNWTFTPSSPLNDGTHAITLTATDAAGNVSQQSLPWSVVVDTTAPAAAPVITSVFDDQGTSTGNLVDDVTTVTDDASPLITGTSEPNGSVIIKDGTMTIGTAAVNGAGIWTFTPTTPLLNGVHQITATAVDANGNTGLTSTAFDFTVVAGGIPTAPAITNVIDDVGTVANIAPNGLTNDPTPTVKGTAHVGYTVKLYSETNVLLGTYLVQADGQWSITVPTLTDGVHSFTATSTDTALNVSLPTGVYQITVDTQAPGPATVLTLTDNVNPRTGLITDGSTTDDATPTFEGTGEVGATVEIKDGVNPLGTTLVNNLGRWTFTPTTPLDDGAHSFTATVTDKAGNTSPATTPINFTVDTTGVVIAIDSVFDNVNAITGYLVANGSTNDQRPTISGTATPGGTVKLYVDGVALAGATATAGSDGQWHITPGTDIAQGPRLLTATVTTAEGESRQTAPFTLTIDLTAPRAPDIVSVSDDVGSIKGLVAANAPSDDSTPTIRGTAEADSKITVFDRGHEIGTTMANGLGEWAFTPSAPLNDGLHALTATATDLAGNPSLASTAWNALIDTTAPKFNTDPNTSANENISSGSVIYSSTTTDASTVTYSISGGADAARFTINSSTGQVTINFSPDYEKPIDAGGNNVYNYIVTATDAAGNQTNQEASFTVLDVPEKPVLSISQQDNGFWVMGGPQGGIKNHFVIGMLISDIPVTYTTNVSLIKVRSDGSVYTDGAKLLQGNRDFSTAEWFAAFQSGVYYRQNGFQITATSASGESTVINVSVGLYNRNGTPSGYTPYSSSYASPFVPPVSLDLNQDGVISYDNARVDINGNGLTHTTAWVGPQDGVLIWDKYLDGKVHDSSQYAFAQYLAGAKTDLEGLKAFDSNGNGKLDSGDAMWNEMRVWQDSNGNGVSDAGEVKTLAAWGITSINLTSDGKTSRPAEGVHEAGKTSATLADGTEMVVADVSFETSDTNTNGVVAHPFILDLNHDGKISYGKELIDVSGAGDPTFAAWAGREDGVLVWDKYHDAQLHDSSQYSFGALTGTDASMQGLKIFDTNTDGKLDSHDVLWNELGVWQINADGVGSMKTLAQLGIQSISLESNGKAGKPADGVTEAGRTTATMTNGDTILMADATFSQVTVDTPASTLSYLDQNQLHAVI